MIELLLRVTVISISGALAPGPLTAATASAGLKRGWKAGLETALGHTLVELPLVVLLAFGVAAVFKNPVANLAIGVVGSAFLVFFGFGTLRDAGRLDRTPDFGFRRATTPLATGVVLTGLNPYFIAWWIGVGTPLINDALRIAGFAGVGLLYIFHVWLDYAWLSLIAALSSVGRFKAAVFRWLLLALGAIVIGFGLNMLIRTLGGYLCR
jgi:threonine/homoserine/homoserine lactone efflux protein